MSRREGWITWRNLGVTLDERRALRRAGIAPSDLEALAPLDLVAASDEVVDDARAVTLIGRATLLRIATPAWVRSLERAGVRDRTDLAGRHPLDLFDTWQRVAAYTHPNVIQYLASTIQAAGGGSFPLPDDSTLVRRAWLLRFGDVDSDDTRPEVAKTSLRIRIEALKVNAPVVHVGDRRPPLDHRHLAVEDPLRATRFIGHWQWAGHFGPFLRLDSLPQGAIVEFGDRRSTETFEAATIQRGEAPIEVMDVPEGGITLITPPHLRWSPWLRDWGLPAESDEELERTWVQVAVVASPR